MVRLWIQFHLVRTRYPNHHLLRLGGQLDHRLEELRLAFLHQETRKRGQLREQVGCLRLLLVEVQVVLLVLGGLVEHLEQVGQGEHLTMGFEQFSLFSLLWPNWCLALHHHLYPGSWVLWISFSYLQQSFTCRVFQEGDSYHHRFPTLHLLFSYRLPLVEFFPPPQLFICTQPIE